MKKKIRAALIFLGVFALVALGFGATVLAGNGTNEETPAAESCCGARVGIEFRGVAGLITELLGLTPEELCQLRQEGYTLTEIAALQGVELEELTAAMVESRTGRIQALVEEGVITPEQAEAMIDRMTSRIEAMLERVAGAGGHGMLNCQHRFQGAKAAINQGRESCLRDGEGAANPSNEGLGKRHCGRSG